MVIPAERVIAGNTPSGRRTKRPEYDSPPLRGDKLELPSLIEGASALPENDQPTVLDLFCGAGGMSLDFKMAGYHIGLGVEREALPHQIHCHNFDDICYLGDIRDITDPVGFVHEHNLKQIDVIIGGPPCQGFSRVGRGKIRSLLNDPDYIHDPRNQYYQEFLRFIEALQPLYFVLENVPDLQYYRDGEELLLQKALRSFRALGYIVDSQVLCANHYGVPQTRKRFFIVGNRLGHKVRWPEKTHDETPVTVWQAISDLPIIPRAPKKGKGSDVMEGQTSVAKSKSHSLSMLMKRLYGL